MQSLALEYSNCSPAGLHAAVHAWSAMQHAHARPHAQVTLPNIIAEFQLVSKREPRSDPC